METFENLNKWLAELAEHADSAARVMIVGNKTDLRHLRAVTQEEGRGLAGKLLVFRFFTLWVCPTQKLSI